MIYRGFDEDWDFVYEFPKQENCVSIKAQIWSDDDSESHKLVSHTATTTVSCFCYHYVCVYVCLLVHIFVCVLEEWISGLLFAFHHFGISTFAEFSCCYFFFFLPFLIWENKFSVWFLLLKGPRKKSQG